MATIVPVRVEIGRGDGTCFQYIWTPVTSADTCAAIEMPNFNDKSVQAIGTFDSASVAVHGSNDGGTTFAALNTPASTAIALTAAGIKAILENTQQVKPVVTGGGGSQSLSIAMLVHQTQPLRQ